MTRYSLISRKSIMTADFKRVFLWELDTQRAWDRLPDDFIMSAEAVSELIITLGDLDGGDTSEAVKKAIKKVQQEINKM